MAATREPQIRLALWTRSEGTLKTGERRTCVTGKRSQEQSANPNQSKLGASACTRRPSHCPNYCPSHCSSYYPNHRSSPNSGPKPRWHSTQLRLQDPNPRPQPRQPDLANPNDLGAKPLSRHPRANQHRATRRRATRLQRRRRDESRRRGTRRAQKRQWKRAPCSELRRPMPPMISST